MNSTAARRPAPWYGQVVAFIAALMVWFVLQLAANIGSIWIHIRLTPFPIATMIACLVTIRVRSLWPAVALVALDLGFLLYVIALNVGSDTPASTFLIRAEIGGSVYLTGEVAVGALAGWLWYRREYRLASPTASG